MSLSGIYPLSAHITIDDDKDEVIAYGARLSGDLMRTLGEPTRQGMWFRVIKVENGLATIETKMEN